MDHQDRELILGLANRLRQAPPVAPDPEAAALIAQQITSQPNAVYLLVQAVLLQEEALRQAQAGAGSAAAPGHAPNPAFAPLPGYGANAGHAQNPAFTNPAFTNPAFAQPHAGHGYGQQTRAGGGFMKTAAAAAAGVAGGALLVAGANELFSDNQSHVDQAQPQGGGEDDFGVADLF